MNIILVIGIILAVIIFAFIAFKTIKKIVEHYQLYYGNPLRAFLKDVKTFFNDHKKYLYIITLVTVLSLCIWGLSICFSDIKEIIVDFFPQKPKTEVGKTVEPAVIFVPVESVSMSKRNLLLTDKQEETLTATIYPDNASERGVIWSSSDVSVATVVNGKVTAVKAGTADITVSSKADGNKSAVCKVTVEQPECGNITYPFGTYKGKSRYEFSFGKCIPEGRQGRMDYTRRVQIAKHGKNTVYAEAGEFFIGEWNNGDIVNGNLYYQNGNGKAVINAGKRSNPYDLSND